MKKIKLLAAMMLMLALVFSVSAFAEEQLTWQYNGDSYSLSPKGTMSGDVTVPAEVNGYSTNAIGLNAFYEQHEITSLTMPETLRALQSGVIGSMNSLTNVTLNDGLEFIGSGNFSRCPALTSLTIPAGVRVFEGSIQSCENLKEIRFEGACPIFLNTDFSFFMMPDDYVIYVPDDQMEAYAAALADCGDVAEHLQPSGKNAVTVPVEDVESRFAFDAATGTITGTTEGNREYHAFLEIPSSIGGVPVKSIGEGAFKGDYSIYGVVFPEGLERIEASAFEHASSIEYIRFPSTLRTIGENGFFNVQAVSIGWSDGLEEIGAHAFRYSHETVLRLPSTVRTIGESAFENSWMNELYMSGDLESIGPRAFAKCSLTYMAFDFYAPIDIAPDAFAENNSLKDLDLPWDSSFENRDAYTALLAEQCPDCTVWINNPVSGGVAELPVDEKASTEFDNGVWTDYEGDMADLTVWPNAYKVHVTGLGDGLFKDNQSIRSFYPHHCGWFTTIGNEAFANSSVEYVELFGSITTIGDGAFRNCTNITELTLPASLTSIGEGALNGCDNLTKLTVLCDPAILPDNLLAECVNPVEVYAAPDATEEQVARLSVLAGCPWYAPVSRVGEAPNKLVEMPYAMLPAEDFWYNEENARLDRYNGYELNLYLPREIDGVKLTMIGGDMMGRASNGDNHDTELPVRSLVIPETYTEIPYWAFANCESLETVICYAPIENLQDFMFKNCTALREVIFVNGVRNLGMYIFDGCTSLETVYVGPYVENVNEHTFQNEDFSVAFDQNNCITDPAQMPDIETLIQAVRSEPMPTPEPTVTPAPAMPVGAEGEPYLGTWRAETMEMGDDVYNVAEMGMTMEMTLNADGTVSMYDGEETDEAAWTVSDGAAHIDDMMLTITEDGKLCMEEDGMKILFGRSDGASDPAPVVTPALETDSGDAGSFVGTWRAETMEMGDDVYNVAEMGMTMEMTLNADGTVSMYDGEETDEAAWTVSDGAAHIDDMILTITDDGKLCMEEDGMKMLFGRSDGASDPAPVVTPALETDSGDAGSFVGTWRAETMEMGDDVYNVAEMGMTMEMTLNADGTVSMYDGEETDEAAWTVSDGTAHIDDMILTITEDGKLCMEEDGIKILFGRSDGASDPAPVVTPAPETGSGDAEAVPNTGLTLEDRLERKFICTSAEISGFAMDAAKLGGEYSLTFHTDGTTDFVIVGTPITGLPWTEEIVQTETSEATAFIVDYYGSKMEAVWTDEGFDMNYFDSMLMHFVPEE